LEVYSSYHPLLVASVFKGCYSTLRSLKYNDAPIGLEAIANSKRLEHLEFGNFCKLSEEDKKTICSLPNLKTLRGIKGFSD
jgi:hypothetical protein